MILVTGGTGLVGSHLLYELTQNNDKIHAIYRTEESLQKVKKVFSYYSNEANVCFDKIIWFKTDLNNIPELEYAFKSVTHVYHCAALISFNPKDFNVLQKTNVEGTSNIVNLCISNNIEKLCYVSSIATLGSKLNETIITEENDWNDEATNSVYAITKYSAELEVWRGTQENLKAVIINPGIIIGPGFWDSGTGLLFKKTHKGLSYTTNGLGGFVAVCDVVAIMQKLMKSTVFEERFIVVGENESYKNVFNYIAKSLGQKPPKKIISKLVFKILWRLDWLKSTLFFSKRTLTKALVKSITNENTYSSYKIKKELNYTFTDLEKTIKKTSNLFLKVNKKDLINI